MIDTGHVAYRTIDLLFAVPLILIEQDVLRADSSKTNLLAGMVAADKKL